MDMPWCQPPGARRGVAGQGSSARKKTVAASFVKREVTRRPDSNSTVSELRDEDGGRTAWHIWVTGSAAQRSGTRARRALRESGEEIREDSHGDKWHNRYSPLMAWAHM